MCINVEGTIKPGYGSSKRPFKSRPFQPRKKRKKIEEESEASEPEEAETEDEDQEAQEEVQKDVSEEESDAEPEIELNLRRVFKLILAKWYSPPMGKRLRGRRPIRT